jgi:hypothetical protein
MLFVQLMSLRKMAQNRSVNKVIIASKIQLR